MALKTLKKRSEFLRIRGGRRYATPAFVLEGRPRDVTAKDRTGARTTAQSDATASSGCFPQASARAISCHGARFGFTITKKLGGAVQRNRIRRRLRAALEDASAGLARADFDYVVLARRAALDRPFEELKSDVRNALRNLHSDRRQKPRKPKPASA